MKRIVRAKSPRRAPRKKKLRGGQIVVSVNSLETSIYVNFTVAGSTISAATTTDTNVTVSSVSSGTIILSINPALQTLQDYSLFGYNGTDWTEIPRANVDMGGTSVKVAGSSPDLLIRKQSLEQKISASELSVPIKNNQFGGQLTFTNITDSIFGVTISASPLTTNAYILLKFTSTFETPERGQTGWLPNAVPGLSLWLDAVEPGTSGSFPNLGTAVSTWIDKSDKNNNATTPAASAPIFQNNPYLAAKTNRAGMYFNGTSAFFSGPVQNEKNYCCVFAVTGADLSPVLTNSRIISLSGGAGINDTTGTNAYAAVACSTTGAATSTTITTVNSATTAASYTVDSTGNAICLSTSWINSMSSNVLLNGIITATFTATISTPASTIANTIRGTMTVTAVSAGIITIGMILSGGTVPAQTMVVGFQTGTGGTGTYFVTTNNIVAAAFTMTSTILTGVCTTPINTANSPNLNLSRYSIGKNNGGGDFFKGYIHEILVYTQPLTKNARQAVEGYLAWKWGITLNSAHPYSSATPTINTAIVPIPLIVQNNAPLVWLDGQDPLANEGSSFPTNSAPLVGWYDKSGNNNHAISMSGFAPTYLANGVMFNGTSVPKITTGVATTFGSLTTVLAMSTSTKSAIVFNSSGTGYFTSYTQGTVSSITPAGTITIISSDFSRPSGIALDSSGDLYVVDNGRMTISRIDMNTGGTPTVSLVAGTPNSSGTTPQNRASFSASSTASVLTVTSLISGTIEIGAVIYKSNGDIWGTVTSYGTGTGTNAGTYNITGGSVRSFSSGIGSYKRGRVTLGSDCLFRSPRGITIDGNDVIYVVDSDNIVTRIRYTGTNKSLATSWSMDVFAGGYVVAGGNANGTADIARFNTPTDIVADSTSTNLYVADRGNNSIRKIEIATGTVSTLVSTGISAPSGLTYASYYSQDVLYISNQNSSIVRYSFSGGVTDTLWSIPSTPTPYAGGLALNGTNLYICVDQSGKMAIMTVPMSLPTYLYSPIAAPITNHVNAFIVCTNSGYNTNVTSILSLGSAASKESYTATTQSVGTVVGNAVSGTPVLAEDTTSSAYIGLYNNAGSRDLFRNNIRVQGSAATPNAPGTAASMPPNLIYFSSSPTSLSMRVNGTAATATGSLYTGTFSYFNIGAYGLGLQPSNIRRLASLLRTNSAAAMNYAFDGFIYEVIIYTTNMTTLQSQLIEAYLAAKWGIPLQDATNTMFYTSATTPPKMPISYSGVAPTAVSNIRVATMTATTITISWLGGGNAAGYSYTITPSASTSVVDNGVSQKSATFTVPSSTTSYTIGVTPFSIGGAGTPATITAPGMIAGMSCTISGNTATVTWSGGTGATSYNYTITPNVANQPSTDNGFASKQAIFTGLKIGTQYIISATPVINGIPFTACGASITIAAAPSTPYLISMTGGGWSAISINIKYDTFGPGTPSVYVNSDPPGVGDISPQTITPASLTDVTFNWPVGGVKLNITAYTTVGGVKGWDSTIFPLVLKGIKRTLSVGLSSGTMTFKVLDIGNYGMTYILNMTSPNQVEMIRWTTHATQDIPTTKYIPLGAYSPGTYSGTLTSINSTGVAGTGQIASWTHSI